MKKLSQVEGLKLSQSEMIETTKRRKTAIDRASLGWPKTNHPNAQNRKSTKNKRQWKKIHHGGNSTINVVIVVVDVDTNINNIIITNNNIYA